MTSQPSSNENQSTRQSPSSRGAGQTAGLRAAAALLATGGYALLTGGVFLAPFALSPYAIQNDVYMSNLFLAPLFFVVGGACLALGFVFLARARGSRGYVRRLGTRALLLAVAGAAVATLADLLFGGRFESVGPVAINWPPYLTMPLLGFALAVGVVVCVVGWVWGASAPTQAELPGTDGSGGAGEAPV